MFARHVTFRLRPNHLMQFIDTYNEEVVGVLQKQPGFRGEITTIAAAGEDVVATSYWESREDAETYHDVVFTKMLELLSDMVEEHPVIYNSEVLSSSFHELSRVL